MKVSFDGATLEVRRDGGDLVIGIRRFGETGTAVVRISSSIPGERIFAKERLVRSFYRVLYERAEEAEAHFEERLVTRVRGAADAGCYIFEVVEHRVRFVSAIRLTRAQLLEFMDEVLLFCHSR